MQSTPTYRFTDTQHSCICMAERAAFQQRQEVRHMQRKLSRHAHTHMAIIYFPHVGLRVCLSYQCVDFGPSGGRGPGFTACMHINDKNRVLAHCVISDCWCLSDGVCLPCDLLWSVYSCNSHKLLRLYTLQIICTEDKGYFKDLACCFFLSYC